MIRALAAAVFVMAVQPRAHAESKLGMSDVTCLGDGTLVGRSEDLKAVVWRDGDWQPSGLPGSVSLPWRSPSGRVFVVEDGYPTTVAELLSGSAPVSRWVLPGNESRRVSFTSLDGIDVVTSEHIYRLEPAGKLTRLGETPVGGSRQRLPRAPEILTAQGTTIVCTGTSVHPDDSVGGSCQERSGAYLYPVDFGRPGCCTDDVESFTTPFVCGNVVISAIRDERSKPAHNRTQARALARGVLLGRTEGAARKGSTCLDGKRALLVGKRDIQIVTVPGLRRLWREKTPSEIQAVAVCHGGTRAFLLPKGSHYSFAEYDLTTPATSGKDERAGPKTPIRP